MAGPNKGRQYQSDKVFEDKYYTPDDVARACLKMLREHLYDGRGFFEHELTYIEPACGGGAFSKILPDDAVNLDINPEYPGAIKQDFLNWLPRDLGKNYVICSNPPYGWQNKLAIAFLQHIRHIHMWSNRVAAIGFVLPRSFTEQDRVYYQMVERMGFKLVANMPTGRTFVKPDGKKHKLGADTAFCIYQPIVNTVLSPAPQSLPCKIRTVKDLAGERIAKADLIGIVKAFKREDIHFCYEPADFENQTKFDAVMLVNSDNKPLLDFIWERDWTADTMEDLNGSYSINKILIERVLKANGFGVEQGFGF